jgi:hypothetical protein
MPLDDAEGRSDLGARSQNSVLDQGVRCQETLKVCSVGN